MARLAAHKARENFSSLLDEVIEKGERVTLHRKGKDVAVIISMEDLALLEELEDRFDLEEAERRLADPTDTPIPYEQARKELGLD